MKRRKNLLLILFFIVATVTAIWVIQLSQGNMPYVDQWTNAFALWLGESYVYEPFRFVTQFGSSFFLYPFVTVVTILLFFFFRHLLPPLLFAGGTFITHKTNELIKELVLRERPVISASLNAEGYSFPSGHAMVSTVCYGLLAYFLTKKLKSKRAILTVQIIFSVLILLVGISRYVLRVHYLTDVVAGFFIGYLFLVGFIFLYDFLMRKASPSKG